MFLGVLGLLAVAEVLGFVLTRARPAKDFTELRARVRSLIGQERKRLSKVIGSAEMRDFMVGRGEGEVPIQKLRMAMMRLPRTLSPKDVAALDRRLKALNARPTMPRGAIPKNMRPASIRAPRGR